MSKKLESKVAMSPILATILLVLIAAVTVVVTYAWVMTLTTPQTQQTEVVFQIEDVRFYGSTIAAKDRTDIILRNTGNADAKIVSVYWSNSSFDNLSKLTLMSEYSTSPSNGIVKSLLSAKITINWDDGYTTGRDWISGTTYFFKIVSEAGQYVEFTSKAP